MKANELQVGDWITLSCLFEESLITECKFYVSYIHGDDIHLSSPSYLSKDVEIIHKEFLNDSGFKLIGKSKDNWLYPFLFWTNMVHPVKFVKL